MEQPSEYFLLVWAVGATILAVYNGYISHRYSRALSAMMLVVRDIAEGKAEIKMIGEGKIQIKKIKD